MDHLKASRPSSPVKNRAPKSEGICETVQGVLCRLYRFKTEVICLPHKDSKMESALILLLLNIVIFSPCASRRPAVASVVPLPHLYDQSPDLHLTQE